MASILLTQGLVDSLEFGRWIVGVKTDSDGRQVPVFGDTPPGTHDWTIRDAKTPGLALRFTSGAATWVVQRKMAGKPVRRRMAARSELKLTTARERAGQWLAMMAQGFDPLEEKKRRHKASEAEKQRAQMTMGWAYGEYVAAKKSVSKPSTHIDRLKIERWMANSPLWRLGVDEIDDAAVTASLGPILAAARSSEVAPPAWGPRSVSPGSASKIYVYLDAAWRRAAGRMELTRVSPFQQWRETVVWPQQIRRSSYLDTKGAGKEKPEHATAWIRKLVALRESALDPLLISEPPDQGASGLKPHVAVLTDYVLCLLLWGTRLTETALLKWTDIDIPRGLILVRPETTKTDRRHIIPLTQWAAEILKARRQHQDAWRPGDKSGWVFPSRQHGKRITGGRSVFLALSEAAKITIRAHDLRRTMATDMARTSISAEVGRGLDLARAALNHAEKSGATAGYIQEQQEQIASLMRPHYEQREQRLRWLAGLAEAPAAPVDAKRDELATLLERVKNDPEAKRLLVEALLG